MAVDALSVAQSVHDYCLRVARTLCTPKDINQPDESRVRSGEQNAIADRESPGQTVPRGESALHIAHECVAGMFAGEMQPIVIAGFPEGTPLGDLALAR